MFPSQLSVSFFMLRGIEKSSYRKYLLDFLLTRKVDHFFEEGVFHSCRHKTEIEILFRFPTCLTWSFQFERYAIYLRTKSGGNTPPVNNTFTFVTKICFTTHRSQLVEIFLLGMLFWLQFQSLSYK